MKKKLLVLSASAILASNFIFDNNASAVVKTTDYKSEALKVKGNKQYGRSTNDYIDSISKLILSQSINEFGGYDEPEYKEAYQEYQGKFLAELDALNKFVLEEDDLNGNNIGLTFQRYQSIYNSLKEHKANFEKAVKDIELKDENLRRFTGEQQEKALKEVDELEDKALMVARVFSWRKYQDARDDLYNKLDMIVGYTPEERKAKIPTNKKMLKETCENLETIIDEFFKDIKFERPKTIEPLNSINQDDETVLDKVWKDTLQATKDKSLRDPGVADREKRAKERLAEMTKASTEAKERATKAKTTIKALNVKKQPKEYSYKKLRQPQTNELLIKFPDAGPQLPTYTVSTQNQTQPVLKQQVKEEKVDILKSKRPESALKGMEGESAPVTVVSEPAIKATAAPQTKEEHTGFSGSNNNLSGMGGESKEVSFTYDSQPVDFDIITESNEIVLDQHTDIKVSGYTTGESIEDSRPSNEVTK
ncbi:coagulase domain-containing protein [Staphylococcus hyicus]|uniref:coagulase domain-containing protein n=1 Tax=Staphylococcus hyicus TaxID=1284 RepID=UPI003735EA8B